MTAINKQITFQLAPFLPLRYPKLKVSPGNWQHCNSVVKRRKEGSKGTSMTWQNKSKAGKTFWRADLQGYNTALSTRLGVGQLRQYIDMARRAYLPCLARPRSGGGGTVLGWATLLLCRMCRHFRFAWLGNLCHDMDFARRIKPGNFIEIETHIMATLNESSGWPDWLTKGVKPSLFGFKCCVVSSRAG